MLFKKEPKVEDFTKKPVRIDWVKVSKEIFEWVLCFFIAYVIYLFINYFIGTISGVRQVSMYPTAQEGERVFISRQLFSKKNYKAGDIITFVAPDDSGYYGIVGEGDDAKVDTDVVANYVKRKGISNFFFDFVGIGKITYIKRIIAVEGDHIVINEDGSVYVNDQKIDEPYLREQYTSRSGEYYDVVVPAGCVFAMGDNREQSKDSRYFGCIPVSKIEGKVVCRVWPFSKWGSLDK